MENASKALLIAGAILICILLIGVGMLVYNGAMNGIDQGIASMDANAKEAFNTQFTHYEGKKSGSNVRALIGNVISSNSANQDIDNKKVGVILSGVTIEGVTLTGQGSGDTAIGEQNADTLAKVRAGINTGATYNVTVQYNNKTGLIKTVTIGK